MIEAQSGTGERSRTTEKQKEPEAGLAGHMHKNKRVKKAEYEQLISDFSEERESERERERVGAKIGSKIKLRRVRERG